MSKSPSPPPSLPNSVLGSPLSLFSKSPLTGFHRDGYCRTSPSDAGHHAVAGIVTNKFLDFSASKGNDLRQIGLTEGCKWCLCTGRWLEAYKAFKGGELGREGVPKIVLGATEGSVLGKVEMGVLKEFAAEDGKGSGESNGVKKEL